MVQPSKLHTLREHLALISTEVYLMMRSQDEQERLNRYNVVQAQIDAILALTDENIHESVVESECPRS